MGMPALQGRRWTSADVRALIDERRPWPRFELLEGELLMTPSPGARHQVVVSALLADLHHYCRTERVGIALGSPADIELAPQTIMQPDVFVVAESRIPAEIADSWSWASELLLAVEVLSPSTERRDRVSKREFYLDNGVGEYWIVDIESRFFERWTSRRQGPDIARDELVWQPPGAANPLRIDVARFFELECRFSKVE